METTFAGFDFLSETNAEKYGRRDINRLNRRHKYIVEDNKRDIKGATVLDLACHDGRWSYAFAAAGASKVVGVEGRPELVDMFKTFPDSPFKRNVEIHCGDLYDFLEELVRKKARFDVVAVLGIFYHVMDHYRLLRLVRALGPKLVIVDSVFDLRRAPIVALALEHPDNPLMAISLGESGKVPIGIPTKPAFEMMTSCLDYKPVTWADWNTLPESQRRPVADYYKIAATEMRPARVRATAYLRPKAGN